MPTCAFCNETATMSGEHVWSAWVGELFGEGPGRYTFKRFGDGGHQQRGPLIAEWKANEINLKANVVCEPCNNRWMSDVENDHAKPTLRDMVLSSNPVSLLPLGVKSIANYCFLKAVIADRMNTKRQPFFSRRQRREFRASLTIPEGVQMWLGRFRDVGRRGNFSTYYCTLKETDYAGFEFYVFTYVVNYVVIQLTAIRWPSLIADPPLDPRGFPFPRFVQPKLFQEDFWRAASTEMWPFYGGASGVLWPPPRTIDGRALDALTFRWQQLKIASINRVASGLRGCASPVISAAREHLT